MERATTTRHLNQLMESHILQARKEVGREIEAVVEEQLTEMKLSLMDTVNQMIETALPPNTTTEISRHEAMLKGFELIEKYNRLGLDELPLSRELQEMVEEVHDRVERLEQSTQRQETIRQKVQELTDIDRIIDRHGARKEALIQILLDIQQQFHWLPKTALRWVSERTEVPLSQIYQIATFYKAFDLAPQGRHHVCVCMGTACQVRGAQRLLDRSAEILDIAPGQTDQQKRFTLSTVNCLGTCASGPVVMVDDDYYSNPSRDDLAAALAKYE